MTYSSKKQFDAAVNQAVQAAQAYYNSDESPLADHEYDTLIDNITEAAEAHPDWDTKGLLDTVAAGTATGGDITHPQPMLSLGKVKTFADLSKKTTSWNTPAVVEPKLDGMAARVEYRNGTLTLVALRGDGKTGEDVTPRAAGIAGLPATIPSLSPLEVRGEVYMTDSDFYVANTNRVAAGNPGFANPRNAVSGSLRREDNQYDTPMTFAAYDTSGDAVNTDSYYDRMSQIAQWGFLPAVTLLENHGVDSTPTSDPQEIVNRINQLEAARSTLGFPIDGAVVKADSHTARETIGDASRHPKWAVAYKYAPDTTTATVKDIELSVGRTGQLGIRMLFDPVTVQGSTITYASGHNVDWMTQQKIGVGTKVFLYKAGDVIPYASVLPPSQQPANVVPWQPPATCPNCGEPWNTDTLMWRCETPSCGIVNTLIYWCSRDAMDVERVGDAVCEALVEKKLVNNVADLYRLTETQIASLPLGETKTGGVRTVGKLNAKVIVEQLNKSKSQPFHRVVTGLGIRGTGRSVSRWLAKKYGSMDALRAATADDIATIEGLGQKKATLIVDGLQALAPVIEALAAAGVNMGQSITAAGSAAPAPFAGQTYVVSGNVPGFTRTTINEAIEQLGGKASSSVSKSTTAVITAETTTSKAKKAATLGVPIVDPAVFAETIAAHLAAV